MQILLLFISSSFDTLTHCVSCGCIFSTDSSTEDADGNQYSQLHWDPPYQALFPSSPTPTDNVDTDGYLRPQPRIEYILSRQATPCHHSLLLSLLTTHICHQAKTATWHQHLYNLKYLICQPVAMMWEFRIQTATYSSSLYRRCPVA